MLEELGKEKKKNWSLRGEKGLWGCAWRLSAVSC
jgi:hypothetical protein